MQDQIDPAAYKEVLPSDDRILITKQGLERLNDSDQVKFKLAGTFQLKNFNELCKLWVLPKATKVN
jgi:hypothetical protein